MKIVAMIAVFNDEDFIQEVIEHNISQGLELVILDNGSTDKTFQICQKFLDKGVLKLFQFKSSSWNLATNNRLLYDLALSQSPDWIILCDSDELLESGIKNQTLKDLILKADSESYNIIQFNRFEFQMSDNDDKNSDSIKEKLKYYSFGIDFLYRAWKFFPGIRIMNIGSHLPIFPEGYKYKIFPKNAVIRHYTFRSIEQAKNKLASRIIRISDTSESKVGINKHYKKLQLDDFPKIYDHKMLTRYEEDQQWNLQKNEKRNPNKLQDKKREEIFSKEGELKLKFRSVSEFKLERQQVNEYIEELKKSIEEKNEIIQNLNSTIKSIQNNFTWRNLTKIDKFRKKNF